MIRFESRAWTDLERIFEFNSTRDPASALLHIERIMEAVQILERHPEIGRLVAAGDGLRELIISYGSTGYVALYEHSPLEGLIRVVAVKHQREVGYR